MIIVQTPLRVSFFGGGTDFPTYFEENGGCVLTTAINKYIFVILKRRYDDMIRVSYTQTEITETVAELRHELIRTALQKTNITSGVEILTLGDIPAGTGLGSSSTVTVGALHAMHAYRNDWVPASQLAEEACDIEVGILGKPIGYQDQYIAAYGGLRFVEFHRDGKVTAESVLLTPEATNQFNERLLLFYTGVTRQADTILSDQKQRIASNTANLNALKEMAHSARAALLRGDFDAIGSLLDESWALKKQLANGISNNSLEQSYTLAREAGALGGKVTGAGGGGFLLLYVQPEKRDAVRRALQHLKEMPFRLEPDGSKIIFNYLY